MRRSGLVMGIIIPTKPCYADRKKARVQRSYSTPSSLFTFSFCAAEGKGGLQRGKREGAQDRNPLPPLRPDGEQTGKTGHARFIIRRKRVKQSANIYQRKENLLRKELPGS